MSCPSVEDLLAGAAEVHARTCGSCGALLQLAATRAQPECAVAELLIAARAVEPLAPDSERRLAAHLESCGACARVVSEIEAPVMAGLLADATDTDRDFADLAEVPADNYVRGHEIGRGGMGRVVLARDLRLGRVVAIKELLDPRLRPRFEREARLTARLQHPAIVSILEAGRWPSGEPFYVMRFVAGRPFHDVIAETATLAERVALLPHFTAVAEAIAYAHSERVIHRDLKPHNILLGPFGETVVIDWGLAKDLRDNPDDAAAPDAPGGGALTLAGAGTPAYMAPEQARGEVPDEGADIYSLGATLHHLLAGRPPGQAAVPADVPVELRAIVDKAMAPARADRYRSAGELVDELARFQTGQLVRAHRYSIGELARRWLRRQRARLLTSAAVAAAIAALVVARTAAPGPSCDGGELHWAGAWDPAVRFAVEGSFLASGRPYGDDTFRHVAADLDGYAARWTAMHRDACEATVLRHEQSDAVLDLRMQCLDRRLAGLRALTALFARTADGELVDRAVLAVSKLDDLAACADRDALAAVTPLPADPAARAEIAALRTRVHDAHALDLAGQYAPALEALRSITAAADRLGYPPLQIEASVALGSVQTNLRDFKAAEATTRRQLALAAAIKDDAQLAASWVMLIAVLQYTRPDDALALRDTAQLAVTRAGDRGTLQGRLHRVIGEAYAGRGNYAAAETALRAATALAERGPEPDELVLAPELNSLGVALKNAGKFGDARTAYQRAVAIWERRLGPSHPFVAGVLTNVASLLWLDGKYDEARATNQRVLAVFDGAYGKTGPAVAIPLDNLGEEEISLGLYDDAAAHLRRAITIDEAASGNTSRDLIPELDNLGAALAYLGRFGEAAQALDRARTIAATDPGIDHPEYGDVLHRTGIVAQLHGRCRDAIDLEQHAIAIYEAKLAKDHPSLASPLVHIGQCDLELGRPRDAIAPLDRAVAIRTAKGGDPSDLAEAQFALGRARWELDHSAAALDLAAAARAGFAALGPVQKARAGDVDRWLAAHRPHGGPPR